MYCRRDPTASPAASLASNDIVVRLAPPVSRRRSCTFACLPVWRARAASSRTAKSSRFRKSSSLMQQVRRAGAAHSLARPASEAEHHLGDAPHLYLLRAFGNSIAPVMPIDVLEGLVTRIAHAPVDLHRAIGGLTDQSVRAIVAHRNLVRQLLCDLGLGHAIHFPRGLVN